MTATAAVDASVLQCRVGLGFSWVTQLYNFIAG